MLYDEEEKEASPYRRRWLLGANCDPVRDGKVEDGRLVLDARSKRGLPGFNRPWPDIVSHDPKMVERMTELLKD